MLYTEDDNSAKLHHDTLNADLNVELLYGANKDFILNNKVMKIHLYGAGEEAYYGAKEFDLTYETLMSGTWNQYDTTKFGMSVPADYNPSNQYSSNNLYRLISPDGSIVISDISEIPNFQQAQQVSDGKYKITMDGVTYTYIIDPELKSTNEGGPNYLQKALRTGKYMLQKGDMQENGTFAWQTTSWDYTPNISDHYINDPFKTQGNPPAQPTIAPQATVLEQKFDENGKLQFERIENSDGTISNIYYQYYNDKLTGTQETIYYDENNYTNVFKDGEGNLKELHKISIDKETNTTTADITFGDGSSFKSVSKQLENGGYQTTSTSYDKEGNLISRFESEHDAKGAGTSITYDKNNAITRKEVAEFDETKNVLTTKGYVIDGEITEYSSKEYYDELGRTLKYESYSSDGMLLDSREYTYSEENPYKMQTITQKNGQGNIVWIEDYSNPETSTTTCFTYDEDGNQIGTCEINGSKGMSWDYNGNLIYIRFNSPDYNFTPPQKAKPNHTITITDDNTDTTIAEYNYDENGNFSNEIHYSENGNIEYVKLTKDGQYNAPKISKPNSSITVKDSNDNIVAVHKYNADGKLLQSVSTYYDKDSSLKTEIITNFDKDLNIESKSVTTFDTNGISKIEFYNGTDKLERTLEYITEEIDGTKYDITKVTHASGNLLYYKKTNSETGDLIAEEHYICDDKGEQIASYSFTDKNGNVVSPKSISEDPLGFPYFIVIDDDTTFNPPATGKANDKIRQLDSLGRTVAEYCYDENGNLAEEVKYENGVLKEKIQYLYPADRAKSMTSDIKIGHSGAEAVKYYYDENGNFESFTTLDLFNKESKHIKLPENAEPNTPSSKYFLNYLVKYHTQAIHLVGGMTPKGIIDANTISMSAPLSYWPQYEAKLDNDGNIISRKLVQIFAQDMSQVPKSIGEKNVTVRVVDRDGKVIGEAIYDENGKLS